MKGVFYSVTRATCLLSLSAVMLAVWFADQCTKHVIVVELCGVWVCACVCATVCVHVCVLQYACMYVCYSKCACVCATVSVHVCVLQYVCMCVCYSKCACVCATVCVHVCVLQYVCMCVCYSKCACVCATVSVACVPCFRLSELSGVHHNLKKQWSASERDVSKKTASSTNNCIHK